MILVYYTFVPASCRVVRSRMRQHSRTAGVATRLEEGRRGGVTWSDRPPSKMWTGQKWTRGSTPMERNERRPGGCIPVCLTISITPPHPPPGGSSGSVFRKNRRPVQLLQEAVPVPQQFLVLRQVGRIHRTALVQSYRYINSGRAQKLVRLPIPSFRPSHFTPQMR